ncbi:MAG TPA: hypothetical protein GX530_10215 [Corynebacteriales bacterium]|nr:hypothetical protein [Mycobacteriales bacterium]
MSDLQFFRDVQVNFVTNNMVIPKCIDCGQPIGPGELCITVMGATEQYCVKCFRLDLAGGDLVIDSVTGDLKLVDDTRFESVAKVALTDTTDWKHYADLGANLSDARGMFNTRANADRIASQLQQAIGLIDSALLASATIRMVPLTTTLLAAFVIYPDGPVVPIPINI